MIQELEDLEAQLSRQPIHVFTSSFSDSSYAMPLPRILRGMRVNSPALFLLCLRLNSAVSLLVFCQRATPPAFQIRSCRRRARGMDDEWRRSGEEHAGRRSKVRWSPAVVSCGPAANGMPLAVPLRPHL